MVRIFNVFLLISSACALKSPRALKVRGGHNTYSLDTLTKVGAGLFGVSGAAAYITPKQNFKAYDMTVTETSALAMMRLVGGWQMGIAALLLADPANVHALSSYVAAGALLLSVPAWESLSAPKQPIAGWIALLAYLGKGGFDGNIPSWVPTALYLVNGAQFHLAPEFSAKLYEAKGVSKLGHSMLGLAGSTMLVGGTYIYALQRGDAQSAALGYAFAVNGALAAKWALTEAEGLGAPKRGPLAWAALSAGIAGRALEYF